MMVKTKNQSAQIYERTAQFFFFIYQRPVACTSEIFLIGCVETDSVLYLISHEPSPMFIVPYGAVDFQSGIMRFQLQLQPRD